VIQPEYIPAVRAHCVELGSHILAETDRLGLLFEQELDRRTRHLGSRQAAVATCVEVADKITRRPKG
jgi:hypothetical protein